MYLRQITKQFGGMLAEQSLPLLLYDGMSHGLAPLFFPPLLQLLIFLLLELLTPLFN